MKAKIAETRIHGRPYRVVADSRPGAANPFYYVEKSVRCDAMGDPVWDEVPVLELDGTTEERGRARLRVSAPGRRVRSAP